MKQRQGQRQTLEQMRAKTAWLRVNQIKGESKEPQDKDSLEKEYRSRVRSLNAMIQINGLGSTLGFLKAKSNESEVIKEGKKPNAPYLLLDHLTKWMIERNFIRTSSDLDEDDSDEADETENFMHGTSNAKDATKQSPEISLEGYDGILNWVISEASREQYRQATTECLAFGLWLRRFAEAELQSSSPRVSKEPQTTENESSTSSEPGEDIAASSGERTQQHGK